ncbi:MAG: hypothetical protein V1723_03355 [Candidatus Uhrbacteria bacterium]
MKECLLLVEQTEADEQKGQNIKDVLKRVTRRLKRTGKVQSAHILAISPWGYAAFLVVQVKRLSVLEGLAGNGVTGVYRSVDERTARSFLHPHGISFVRAAYNWSTQRKAPPAAAT